MAENSAGKQRGAPFQKGKSGNPNGKPKGTRHRITVLAEKLMQDDAKDIVSAVLEAAKGGDMTAARLILERIFPVRKGRPIYLDLPAVRTAADIAAAMTALYHGDGIRRSHAGRGGVCGRCLRDAAQDARNAGI